MCYAVVCVRALTGHDSPDKLPPVNISHSMRSHGKRIFLHSFNNWQTNQFHAMSKIPRNTPAAVVRPSWFPDEKNAAAENVLS